MNVSFKASIAGILWKAYALVDEIQQISLKAEVDPDYKSDYESNMPNVLAEAQKIIDKIEQSNVLSKDEINAIINCKSAVTDPCPLIDEPDLAINGVEDSKFEKLMGKKIGQGRFREVFEHKDEPEQLVVKKGNCRMNLRESRIWNSHGDDTIMAPVVECSESGKYLVMRRTEEGAVQLTESVLRLMATISQYTGGFDMNPENYGILNGNFVCHDYGGVV